MTVDVDKLCFGIDFGTTNSCISIWINNKPEIIKDGDDNFIPTVLEMNEEKKNIGKRGLQEKKNI